MKNTFQIGDYVMSKHGKSKIKRIELCEKVGEKYGLEVDKMFTNLLDRVIIDLENGHWSYGTEVELVVERVS